MMGFGDVPGMAGVWDGEYLTIYNMTQRADGESLGKFLRDRELLPYNDAEIARRIGMDRSNFSSYINGHLPITRSFLRRFYTVFGPEVEVMRERRKGVLEGNGIRERLDAMEERLNWLTEEFRKIRGEGIGGVTK